MIKAKFQIKTADGRSLRWNFHQPEKLRVAKKDCEVIVLTDEDGWIIEGKPRVIGQQLFLIGPENTYVMDLAKVIGWIYAPKNLSKDETDDAP